MTKEELRELVARAMEDGTELALTASETRSLHAVLADDGLRLRVQAMAMAIDAFRNIATSAGMLVEEARKIEEYLTEAKP